MNPSKNDCNQRIAKNAVMLYIRIFLTMIVGLYTSHAILDVSGVEDYDTYGVVGCRGNNMFPELFRNSR